MKIQDVKNKILNPNRKDSLSGARLAQLDGVLHLMPSIEVRELRRNIIDAQDVTGKKGLRQSAQKFR